MFWGMPHMDGIATAPVVVMFWGVSPMARIAAAPVALSSAAIAQKAALEASPESPYHIPDGWLLRNTFLELEDESDEAAGCERRGGRRSRSCPAETTTARESYKLACESLLSTRSPTSEAGTPSEDASILDMERQWRTQPDMNTDVESWRHMESLRDLEELDGPLGKQVVPSGNVAILEKLRAPPGDLQAPHGKIRAPPGKFTGSPEKSDPPQGRLRAPATEKLSAPLGKLASSPGKMCAPPGKLCVPTEADKTAETLAFEHWPALGDACKRAART